MRSNLLFTGGTGFIGRNVLPILREKFEVFAPTRAELDLFDETKVREYIIKNGIDFVIHAANPNPSRNSLDESDKMLTDSIRIFLSFYHNRDVVKKLVFLGSGAMYGKQDDIVSVKEEDFEDRIPYDDYGVAKQMMAYLSKDNVYDLVIFGCYGPTDAESKFITHCIRCCLRNEPITIRQNCMFDYMHVFDLAKIMCWAIDGQPEHNIYNACSGKRVSLLEIAQEVKRQMNSKQEIIILKDGWNKEYTASNEKLTREYKESFIPIEEGIKMQIEFEKQIWGKDESI